MVVFDTSVLAIVLDKNSAAPLDPVTRAPMENAQERINFLIQTLASAKTRIIIPTPVVAEYMVAGGPDKEKRLALLTNSRSFVIEPFDLRAAVECALIENGDVARGRPLDEVATKAKVKFDRQILAIAISRRATTIYTGDERLAGRAKLSGLGAVLTWELPHPPISPQADLDLGLIDLDLGINPNR